MCSDTIQRYWYHLSVGKEPRLPFVAGNMVVAVVRRTTEEWEGHLGGQVRRARIDASLGQDELADRAGVSVGAVRGLERGAGSSLKTLIRVARTLGRDDWLESFAPAPGVAPLDLLRGLRTPRQKVYRARKPQPKDHHGDLPLPTVLPGGRRPAR